MADQFGLVDDIAPAETPKEQDVFGLVNDIPAEAPVKTWSEIQPIISDHTTPQEQKRISNALQIADVHKISFDAAFDAEPQFIEKVSKVNRFLFNPAATAWESIKQGYGGIVQSVGESMADVRSPAQQIADELEFELPKDMPGLKKSMTPEFMTRVGEHIATKGREITLRTQKNIESMSPKEDSLYIEKLGFMVIHNIGVNAPGLVAAIITKRPMAALSFLGGVSYGNKYTEERKSGATPEEAHTRALSVAGSEVGTEFIPISILLKPGLSIGKRIVQNLFSELVGENINTAYEMMQDKAIHDPDKPFGDFVVQDLLPAFRDTTLVAGISSLAMSGAVHPFVNGIDKTSEEATKKVLDEIASTPEGEKEIKDSIEKFKEQAQNITGKAEVDLITEGIKPSLEVTQEEIARETTGLDRSEKINAIRLIKTKDTKSYADIKNVPPTEQITIYRAIPKGIKSEILPGDFVAVDEEVAKFYANDLLRRNKATEVSIISKEISASEIKLHPSHQAIGVENEFIYNPKPQTVTSTPKAEDVTEADITDFVDTQIEQTEEQLQKAPIQEAQPMPSAQTVTELVKRYVNETGEKINTQEDIEKVKAKYPEEFAQIEAENKLRQKLWNNLPEDFRKNRGLNEYSTHELQQMAAELPKEFKIVTPETKGVKNIKQRIRQTTGQVTLVNMIREDKALEAAFKKSQQAARAAYRAGNMAGVEVEQIKMKNMLSRAKKIKAVQEFFNLTYADMKKVSRKNPLLMSQYEFKLYLDDVRQKAFELTTNKMAKIALTELIRRKNLQKVENLQRALKYPSIDKMNLDQLNNFFDILDKYKKDDVFLSERRLEVVDRSEGMEGVKTWREAKEVMAKEIGVPVEELSNIIVSQFDKYRYDSALMQRNPFFHMVVTEIHRSFINAEMRFHEIKLEAYRLAKAAEASRPQSWIHKFIPQNKLIMGYLETSAEQKTLFLNQMTPEEIDYAHFIEEYFEGALEYLVETQSLTKGRENYFVHMRQGFLENVKEEGLLTATKNIFKHYKEDEVVFNILDEDTGNILPLEKFFQFSLHRTGGLLPTSNVTEAFLAYSKMFERKVSFDKIIPKLDIYAQALTPQKLTPHGLEMDRSLKKFLNQYINNKKGRHIDQFVGKQGGAVDMGLRAIRSFTSLLDLGLNIPVGITALVGEQVTNFVQLGVNNMAKGAERAFTPHGKAITQKYEAWLGRSPWEQFTSPGKGITEKIHDLLFIGFHESARIANINYLLGMITDQEFNSETITDKRLAELQLEMGRMRVVPGSKSLVGSTSLGSVLTQYKTWAIPIMSTIKGDISTFVTDLRKKPFNEALTTKEARELYRIAGLSSAIIITGAVLAGDDDENDTSFFGALKRKFYRESLSLIGALDPTLYTPIRVLSFMTDLAKNLKAIALLEQYKTKPEFKGVEGLKKQLIPKAIKQFIPEEKKFKR